jgi:hypothetical protein
MRKKSTFEATPQRALAVLGCHLSLGERSFENMKAKVLLSFLITLTAFGSIAAQSGGDLQQVTLYDFSPSSHEFRSALNFRTGNRSEYHDFTGFHLAYGGAVIQEGGTAGQPGKVHPDWLRVLDSRSMIVDLGARNWQDFKETPPFPKPRTSRPPLPLSPRPFVVDASAGSQDFSPYRQMVEVEPGHMYLIRVSQQARVFYAMFRVESLESRVSCVLSFKLVKPPNVDDEK